MTQEHAGSITLTISKEKIQEIIDLLTDAKSTPDDEFPVAVTTMNGDVSINKSLGDENIFWLTINHD